MHIASLSGLRLIVEVVVVMHTRIRRQDGRAMTRASLYHIGNLLIGAGILGGLLQLGSGSLRFSDTLEFGASNGLFLVV